MSVQFKTPNITGSTDREKLVQIQSYLYQMAKQLQWAFDTIGTGTQSAGTTISNAGGKGKAAAADPLTTFAGLKKLIIKSADIVNAYYDEINSRLEGVYVAKSDFGTYKEKTAQEIQGNSTSISQLFTNEQTINTKIDNIQTDFSAYSERTTKDIQSNSADIDQLFSDGRTVSSRLDGMDSENERQNNQTESLKSEMSGISGTVDQLVSDTNDMGATVDELYTQSLQTSAYLKSGLLYEDDNGIPVYGLEIGQTNSVNGEQIFDKFARFTADRLSFFDRNDVEVAYISDYRLYITNAEITGTLQLSGRFKIYYNHGLAFQWTGGNR